MLNTSSDRIITLLKTLELTEMDLAHKIRKPPATVYRIVKKECVPSKPTLQIIAQNTGASYQWLLTGEGTMFNQEPQNAPTEQKTATYRDSMLTQLKEENNHLKREIERLWQMLEVYTSGSRPSFQKASDETGFARVIYMHTAGYQRSAG